MTVHASTLDIEKLRKVHALMQGGKTEGERAAATAKAEALALRAGLTLQQALSRLDMQVRQTAGNPFTARSPFQDFGDWMEAKEPGWKAKEAKRRAEKEAARLARCQELLAEYGSEDAVFAATTTEAALRKALAPLVDGGNALFGYRGFSYSKGPTPDMWQAMRAAVRVPETVAEAWLAFQAHEARTDARCTIDPDYTSHEWEEAWRSALEYLLDHLRTPTADDISARLDWMEHIANRDMTRGVEADRAVVAALKADFAAFAASAQTGRDATQRPADRAAAVRALLAMEPGLSDREVARRIGCSPQTVGNWRRKMAA